MLRVCVKATRTTGSYTLSLTDALRSVEKTRDREIGGKPSATYLWEDRGVVPILKVDRGLQDQADGVRLMKPIDGLDAFLARAVDAQIFGTKMRSVIDAASPAGIAANVAQQVDLARTILAHGLVPIVEPEVTITISDKAEAEDILLAELESQLDALPGGQQVILKLTLPERPNLYRPLMGHDRILRIAALSGGYSRAEATERLAQNSGMIASFSRALTEGLSDRQSGAEFNDMLDATIGQIYAASIAG